MVKEANHADLEHKIGVGPDDSSGGKKKHSRSTQREKPEERIKLVTEGAKQLSGFGSRDKSQVI